MFIDEARLVAKLHHPNIVQIFDFDKEGDRYHLAMELIEGRDLRQAEKSSAKAGVWFPLPLSVIPDCRGAQGPALRPYPSRSRQAARNRPPRRLAAQHPHQLLGRREDLRLGIAKGRRARLPRSRRNRQRQARLHGVLSRSPASPRRAHRYLLDGHRVLGALTRHRLPFGPDEHDVIRRVRDGIVPRRASTTKTFPKRSKKRSSAKMLVANRSQRYPVGRRGGARALCALPQYNHDAQALASTARSSPRRRATGLQVLQTLLATPGKAGRGVDPSGLPVKVPKPHRRAPPSPGKPRSRARRRGRTTGPGPAAATMLPGAISAAALMPAKAPPPVGPPPPPPC